MPINTGKSKVFWLSHSLTLREARDVVGCPLFVRTETTAPPKGIPIRRHNTWPIWITVQPTIDQFLSRIWQTKIEMPRTGLRNGVFIKRPHIIPNTADRFTLSIGIHRDIARSRGHRPCFHPWAPLQEMRVIATNDIDNLSNLKKAQSPSPTCVKQPANRGGE